MYILNVTKIENPRNDISRILFRIDMFSIPKKYGVEYGFNICGGHMEKKYLINFNYLIFIAYYIIIYNDISEKSVQRSSVYPPLAAP